MKTNGKTTRTGRTAAKRQMAKMFGGRRIERMSWKTLAKIYYAARPGSAARKAIDAECRRLGYTPRIVLSLNAE